MVYTIISLLIIGAILLIDKPKLKKYKNSRKDLWVYFGILGFGSILLLIHGSGRTLPTPLYWISAVLKPIISIF
ncbi:hypothetical protein ABE41_005735 [Fictibacillus arsenicus]|uniref:Uncharacterized protein n=1 Tax=Fictibacillus arsenicus TaxID=255247 RepID=A0A1B1Z2B7_9BACL|nr:hypothetical protein [Fictibacillus arsenicus]ANX11501.1 hypothetical protein ABE41_005735 [Fictibacillus arsenicus]